MKITISACFIALLVAPPSVHSFGVTKKECEDQGGVVAADTTGQIFDPDYKCANTNEAPTDFVFPAEGEPFPAEFEVCCGGTGGELFDDDSFGIYEEYTVTAAECTGDMEGNVVNDSGDGAVYKEDYICASDNFPPIANVTNVGSETPIGVCCLEPWILTTDECTDMLAGEVVADSGNGAVLSPDYTCESDGYPPIGGIGNPPTAVCCLGPDMGTAWEFDDAEDGSSTAKSLKTVSNVKKSNAVAHKGNRM